MRVLVEANVVEDEELGFGAEKGGVGDAGVLQVQLGFFGDPARVAVIVLARDGIDNIAEHDQRARFGKRIHESGGGIGNDQHVAFVDSGPAANARAVDAEAIFERLLFEHGDGIGDVLAQARQVGKAQIELPGIVLLGKFENFLRGHMYFSSAKPIGYRIHRSERWDYQSSDAGNKSKADNWRCPSRGSGGFSR